MKYLHNWKSPKTLKKQLIPFSYNLNKKENNIIIILNIQRYLLKEKDSWLQYTPEKFPTGEFKG